jgi:hypothetical protein
MDQRRCGPSEPSPNGPDRRPGNAGTQERAMRFGAGVLVGIAIGVILVIYLLARLIF